jgi:hypothetical protein
MLVIETHIKNAHGSGIGRSSHIPELFMKLPKLIRCLLPVYFELMKILVIFKQDLEALVKWLNHGRDIDSRFA